MEDKDNWLKRVSTHSRLKAAGNQVSAFGQFVHRFNTQPPEGGWAHTNMSFTAAKSFNTQPPEGGWCRRLPK